MSNNTGYYVAGGAAAIAALAGAYVLSKHPTSPITSLPPNSTILLNGVLSVSASSITTGQSIVATVTITDNNGNTPVSGVPVIIVENTTNTEGTIITNASGIATMNLTFSDAGTYSITGEYPEYVVT